MKLLDANVFITANNIYYGFDIVPAFWVWIEDQGLRRTLASTDLIYDELQHGGGELAQWAKERRELSFS